MVVILAKKKRHRKRSKAAKEPTVIINEAITAFEDDPVLYALAEIFEKRRGGAASIQGFFFQFKYAAWQLLSYLNQHQEPGTGYIRLEGIEDVDFMAVTGSGTQVEFAQVKHSKNKMDAGGFWKTGALQNFAEVYLKLTNSHFRLVHNMDLAGGNLRNIVDFSAGDESLSAETLQYWNDKFTGLQRFQKEKIEEAKKNGRDFLFWDWDWSSFDIEDFLGRLKFEKVSERFINSEIQRLIIDVYGVMTGNERQYIRALDSFILESSRCRAKLNYQDLVELFESVKEDIAKGAINPAVQNRWIEAADFSYP